MTETVPPVADAATRDQRALLDSILTAAIRAAHPDLCLPPALAARGRSGRSPIKDRALTARNGPAALGRNGRGSRD
ncbi:hypothetical protein CTI14_53105, partial [Methylobacterium radiotolerans]